MPWNETAGPAPLPGLKSPANRSVRTCATPIESRCHRQVSWVVQPRSTPNACPVVAVPRPVHRLGRARLGRSVWTRSSVTAASCSSRGCGSRDLASKALSLVVASAGGRTGRRSYGYRPVRGGDLCRPEPVPWHLLPSGQLGSF